MWSICFYMNYINNTRMFIKAFPDYESEGNRLIEQAQKIIDEIRAKSPNLKRFTYHDNDPTEAQK